MEERQDKVPAAGGESPDAQNQARTPQEELAELRAAVVRYKEEAEHNWQQFLHAAADLENYTGVSAARGRRAAGAICGAGGRPDRGR